MHEKVLSYSLVEGIKKTQLQSGSYEPVETTALEARVKKHGVFGFMADESAYHYKLQTITRPPYIYYGIGDHDVLCLPLLGVVGPRKMSSYAQEVLKNLFDELKKYEIATVSGMAPGVDSLCHELSISYGIPTIAVLGGGLGYFLKSNKRHMIDKIVYHDGLVLSEFKLGQSPTKRSYPQRNRIIAGLGQCLFVPEAKVGSGSLITVENALSIHKPVYGAPQSLFAINSQGLLQYMESGKVKLVLDLASFLHDEFGNFKKQGVTPTHVIPREDLTKKQKTLCSLLQSNSLAIHQLTEKLGWEVKELMAELTVLEIMQVVGEDLGVYSLVK